MSVELLPCAVQTTGPEPEYSVIWLHGLGADGHDFEPIVPHLGLGNRPAVRFVFPHAPQRPVTINGGMVMRAWYDFETLSIGDGEAPGDIEQSVEHIDALIAAERERGIAPNHIVLAGFSQGGVIALTAGLDYPECLAGIMGLSTYLRADTPLPAGNQPRPPIFMGHGEADPVIALPHGEQTARRLGEQGLNVTWRTYPMEHAVCQEEIDDIGAWLRSIIGG